MSEVRFETRIEPLAEEWEELADRTGACPFARPGWFAAWWRAFGAGRLAILTLRRADRLAGLLPLHRPAWRAPAFKTEPLPLSARPGTLRATANWHLPRYEPLAEDEAVLAELARALLADRGPLVSLAMLDPAQPALAECRRAAQAAGYRVLPQRLPPSPYVDIDGDWTRYQRGLGGKLVADLRRRRRRLGESGSISVEVADGSERLDQLLAEGLALEPSGWKAARGSAIASRSETSRFYREVAGWAAERGWLRLAFLRLDRRPLAFQFGIEDNGMYSFLKGGYDPAYQRFAPGRLLAHAMIERAFSAGLQRFDFCGGDEPWKLDWTNTCRERIVLHAFAPTAAGRLEWAAVAHGRPFRAGVRARLRTLAPQIKRLRA